MGAAIMGSALLLGATGADAKADGKGDELHARLEAAFETMQKDDCPGALEQLRGVIDRPGFGALPDSARSFAYEIGAYCAASTDPVTAHRYAMAGTALDTASPNSWDQRLRLEVVGKRYTEAVATVEAMAARNPEALNAVQFRVLVQLSRKLRENAELRPQRKRLLAILAAPAYQPEEATASSDGFRQSYAAMLAEDGDKAAAAAIVRRIEEPVNLIQISVDQRLRDALPADFDGRAAVEAGLVKAREFAASHSGSMGAVLEIARHLRQLGRPEEALATLEAARPDGPQAASFTDLDDRRNWWWDDMARSYRMLGRYDEAVNAYRQAIGLKEGGRLNVSQTINLAYAYLEFGKWGQAVATVADFENGGYDVSPYGLMQMRSVRGCARFLLGQTAEAKADLDYVEAHDKDDPESLTWLSLCADDMEGAAASIIRRLDNADDRSRALLELSDYDDPPPAEPKMPFEGRIESLKARPDVAAAIQRAGGVRRFRLQPGEF